ncbi:hypothetical protein [Lacticaseibacillus paracasei]|uniref:hypothetical protein n=3 Tax=Lacticaseibacillus paracasei TaxID=1597 RepID=UPI00235E0B49|nr:hypothetical protein [Lacticaseibacillus paracasei]
MRDNLSYTEIFTPGTIPNETYNNRASIKLEPKLNSVLAVGGNIAILSGQSKVGKTVLFRKVVPDDKRIEILPDDLDDGRSLETAIAKKLRTFPTEKRYIRESENSDKHSADANAKVSAGVSFWRWMSTKMEASIRGSVVQENTNKYVQVFEDDLFDEVMDYVIKNEYVIVFDDFHYFEEDTQRKLIHRLKEPLSRRAKIVIVLIPNRNEDVIAAEPDMKGRTKVIDVPLWSEDELRYIPEAGFSKLNVSLTKATLDEIVDNSFSNPYLIQSICSLICEKQSIFESLETHKTINIEVEELHDIFHELRTTNSLMEDIERGKTTKGNKRKKFFLKASNEEIDTYGLIMRALGKLASRNRIDIADLVKEIHGMVINNNGEPRRSDVVGTLNRMVDIAKKSNARDPAISVDRNTVIMYDPFFSFDVRWRY